MKGGGRQSSAAQMDERAAREDEGTAWASWNVGALRNVVASLRYASAVVFIGLSCSLVGLFS